jgi:hypothetical protein
LAELRQSLTEVGFQIGAQVVFPVVGVPLRDALLRLLPPSYRGDHQYIVGYKPAV